MFSGVSAFSPNGFWRSHAGTTPACNLGCWGAGTDQQHNQEGYGVALLVKVPAYTWDLLQLVLDATHPRARDARGPAGLLVLIPSR